MSEGKGKGAVVGTGLSGPVRRVCVACMAADAEIRVKGRAVCKRCADKEKVAPGDRKPLAPKKSAVKAKVPGTPGVWRGTKHHQDPVFPVGPGVDGLGDDGAEPRRRWAGPTPHKQRP